MEATTASLRSKGLLTASAAILAASVAAIILVPQTMRGLLSTQFLPHAYCYLYDKGLIALHLGSDTIIWLSYVSISITLAYLVHRTRREIPFSWMFLAFGTFIIACGFTHFMEVVVLWKPLYWLSADVKIVTAMASVITAIALPPLIPKVPEMIAAAKTAKEHEEKLEIANNELFHANQSLQAEVGKRTHAEEELRALSGRLLRLQDDERRRLARELHDSTGQLLAAIQLNLSLVIKQLAGTDGTVHRWLDDSLQLTHQAIGDVRTMSYLLHPPMLDEAGLGHALQWYVDGFVERSGIEVTLSLPPTLDRLSAETEVAVFRMVQECLTNIHRHSESRKANISVTENSDKLVLSIRDYGKGIPNTILDAQSQGKGTFGVGLRGMLERVRQLGGSLAIAAANPGTLVQSELPLMSASEKQLARSTQKSGC
jgi:signal transduction histidine kinase